MNKAINSLLLLLLFPTMLLTIFVGFDLPIDFLRVSGANLPYRFEAFLLMGTLILLLLLRRSVKRWMGANIVRQQNRFKWNVAAGPDRVKRIMTYIGLESLIMTAVAVGLYSITPEAWPPALAFLFGALEGLIFGLVAKSKKWFRIGLSSKALIVADREVTLLYFNGLRKISVHQQSVYFDYIQGLQLSFPVDCLPEGEEHAFFSLLEANVNRDKVFFEHKR